MKDLKHMIFFEELLRQSHNTLVQQAVDEGQLALGYNCYYIPEVLLNLKGCFPRGCGHPTAVRRRWRRTT